MRRNWTKEEIDNLIEMYNSNKCDMKKIGDILNRSRVSCESKIQKLRKCFPNLIMSVEEKKRMWNKNEDDILITMYNSEYPYYSMNDIAEILERTRIGCESRIQRLRKRYPKLVISVSMKQRIASSNRPPITDETRKKLSIINTGRIFTDEWKKKISENHADVSGKNNPRYGKPPNYPRNKWKKRGKMELGHPVRSSWEFNFCRFLQEQLIYYQYEPETFELILENGKECTYTPDFYIPLYDIWFEVKGYMSEREKNKINEFRKIYQNFEVLDRNKLSMIVDL